MAPSRYKYRFSMIMAVHNAGPYLDDAMRSLVSQSYNFLKGVQVVLVNDGSTDDSEAICLKYRDLYPENVVYAAKDNGGVGSARNLGIELAQGEIYSFMDPDDTLSTETLKQVSKFFHRQSKRVDIVTVPISYFEGKTGLHPRYDGFPTGKNAIIDLMASPSLVFFSSASTFYKARLFRELRFDEAPKVAEDLELNLGLLRARPQFGFVSAGGAQYNYRVRDAGTSATQTARTDYDIIAGAASVLERSFPADAPLLDFEKELLAYQCAVWYPLALSPELDASEGQRQALAERLAALASRLEVDFIWQRSKSLRSTRHRALLLQATGRPYRNMVVQGTLPGTLSSPTLLHAQIAEGELEIAMCFSNWETPEIDLVALFDDAPAGPNRPLGDSAASAGNTSNGTPIHPSRSFDGAGPFDKALQGMKLDVTHVRFFAIPCRTGKLSFAYNNSVSGTLNPTKRIIAHKQKLLKTPCGNIACDDGTLRVRLEKNALIIEPSGPTNQPNPIQPVSQPRNEPAGVASVADIRADAQPSQPRNEPTSIASIRAAAQPEKHAVLISDRPEKAGDNGEALFAHIMEHADPVLRERTYYAIDEGCADYRRLKARFGAHVIARGSLEHKLLFVNAAAVFSSHNARAFFCPFSDQEESRLADLYGHKLIWLQHGVTQNDIAPSANRFNAFCDFITVATRGEYAEFLAPRYFYDAEQVLLTGFARFDALHSEPRGIITVAPTWRRWLSGKMLPNGHYETKGGFDQSEFFETYRSLLESPRLHALLEDHDLRLKFLVHPAMVDYETALCTLASDRVEVVRAEDVDYPASFAESSLFVTDYSSTAFDFAYLRKPVVYYQFDADEFFSKQYARGYFDYARDGFGPVCTNEDGLIDAIGAAIARSFELEKTYAERTAATFAHADRNNCQRILDATMQHIFPNGY